MSDAYNNATGKDAADFTPWDDPLVKDALKSGRDPSDIMLMECPSCGIEGYYNQGGHFSCAHCNRSWACITEDETAPSDRPYIMLGEEFPLSEWDGFDHEG